VDRGRVLPVSRFRNPRRRGRCAGLDADRRLPGHGRHAPRPRLAASGRHTCVVTPDAGVSCWGNNRLGQLGDGTLETRLTPVRVLGVAGASTLAVGAYASCAVVNDGDAVCWGVLGHPDGAPSPWGTGMDATQVAVGAWRACALQRSGQVLCVGGNPSMPRGEPTPVQGLDDAVEIGGGAIQSLSAFCAVRANGMVSCWQEPSRPVAVPRIDDAVHVTVGGARACALRRTGEVTCWLAREPSGAAAYTSDAPAFDEYDRRAPSACPLRDVRLAMDGTGMCTLDADGVVACDPLESSGGYLTDAESVASDEATAHVALPAPPVVAGMRGVEEVAVSPRHVCTLDASRDVQCWGQWSLVGRGDMGRWTQTPVEVAGIADAVGIALDGSRQWSRGAACALLRSGHVSCWGDDGHLPLGRGPLPPFLVDALDDARDIDFDDYDSRARAVRANGTRVRWYVGHGGADLAPIEGTHDVARMAGDCVLHRTGTVSCKDQGDTWRPVAGLADAVSIGWRDWQDQLCAVRRDRRVACWIAPGPLVHPGISDGVQAIGDYVLRASGQVTRVIIRSPGDDPNAYPFGTEDVDGITDATELAVSAFSTLSCVVRRGGTVACWSSQSPEAAELYDPVGVAQVPGLSDATHVAVGDIFACAVRASGAVACWGLNRRGVLGNAADLPERVEAGPVRLVMPARSDSQE
jgi:hypothetical protein